MTRNSSRVAAVLFDLDGTLLDTAPDLAAALNRILVAEGREPLPFAAIRPWVSHGGRALLRLGFGLEPEDVEYPALARRFLQGYRQHIAEQTRLFPGMAGVLEALAGQGIPWGVVTNKPAWLTKPLLDALGLREGCCALVCGDTTATPKPHPMPVLHACRLCGVSPGRTLTVGDAERDIRAGQRAGTLTLAAGFGYLGAEDRPAEWGADACIDTPEAILSWLAVGGRGR